MQLCQGKRGCITPERIAWLLIWPVAFCSMPPMPLCACCSSLLAGARHHILQEQQPSARGRQGPGRPEAALQQAPRSQHCSTLLLPAASMPLQTSQMRRRVSHHGT